ncbi:MAG: hypothetical protein ACLFNT_07870 [Spirochaetales bacterium]
MKKGTIRVLASGAVLVAAALILSACLGEQATVAETEEPLTRSDNFDSGSLNERWAIYDSDCYGVHDPSGSTYDSDVVQFVNGQLKLDGNGRDFWGSAKDHVGIWRTDFTGDFDVSVKIVEMYNLGNDPATTDDDPNQWSKAGIVVANDRTDLDPAKGLAHFHAFGPVQDDFGGWDLGRLMANSNSPPGFTNHEFQIEVNPTTNDRFPVWLRLKRTGNDFQGYYKYAEGDDWTAFGTAFTPTGVAATVQIGLFSVARQAPEYNNATSCPDATLPDTGFYTIFDDFEDLDPPENP